MSSNPGGSQFDRVRPRAPRAVPAAAPVGLDAQGKRSLFSSVAESSTPGFGNAVVECSRCGERRVLGFGEAARAAFPSLHLGLRVGRGGAVRSLSVLKRDYPTYMRCPACGRPSWVRFTLQIQI